MAPLWEEGVRECTRILEKRTTPKGLTHIYILNATTIHAKLHCGDKTRPSNSLETTLPNLKATLALSADHEHRKLPKHTTIHTQVIHTSWHKYIEPESLPTSKHTNYEKSLHI
jgi:hypothetical protein